MTTFKKIALTAFMGLGLFSTTVYADADKGLQIYKAKLKSVCGMNGGTFAAKHTQAEWEDAQTAGTLGKVMTDICPAGKEFFESDKFKSKYSEHLYDFVHDFASDSGNIPSC